MKKYILFVVVIILVLSAVGISRTNPVWASILPAAIRSAGASQPAAVKYSPTIPAGLVAGENSSGVYAPPAKLITITENGIYNVGGVCTIEVEFKVTDQKLIADAEVPLVESQKVPFGGVGDLLYPGCHFVHFKQNVIVNPMNTVDGSAKVCFGASTFLTMTIYYYLDNPTSGSRVWIPLATTLEDNGRLVCAPAMYTGVYMPAGKYIVKPDIIVKPGTSWLFPGGLGGSIMPPAPKITVTGGGTYPVGGICLFIAKYKITGLSDTVEVYYPSEDTVIVPSEDVAGLFYFPGCQVIHYKDLKVKDEMTRAEGDWRICFAAMPGKTMTIYYYKDNLTDIIPPWIKLVSTTEKGMVCADLVDFSGTYTPTGK